MYNVKNVPYLFASRYVHDEQLGGVVMVILCCCVCDGQKVCKSVTSDHAKSQTHHLHKTGGEGEGKREWEAHSKERVLLSEVLCVYISLSSLKNIPKPFLMYNVACVLCLVAP